MATDPSTVIIDGVEVSITTGAVNGDLTRTTVVPIVTAARQDQNGNDTADIPLTTQPGGAPGLSAHLPTGYGMRVEALQDEQPSSRAVALLQAQIEAHVPAAGQAAMIAALPGLWSWELERRPLTLSAIMPTLAADGAPGATMGLSDQDAGRMALVLIDTNGLANAPHIALSAVDLTLITGAGTFEQVPGRANILADDASQTIRIDGAGDYVRAGGGDDRIIAGQGIMDGVGHLTFNDIDGGEGRDTVQLAGPGRDDYVLGLYGAENGNAWLAANMVDRGYLTFHLRNIEVLQFAEASADTSARGSLTRLYESLLDRSPDAGGFDYWMRALAGDATLEAVAQSMLASAELAGTVPQANGAYVAWLYDQVLGRPADAGGLAYWTAILDGGDLDRGGLALAFVDSSEKLALSATNQLEIGATDLGVLIRMYDALYDRRPDLDGLNYWLDRSQEGAALADIADAFVDAAETTDKLGDSAFVAQLYRQALEREATATELTDWSALLGQGRVDRGDVLLALAESAEMVQLVGAMSSTFEVM